MIVAASLDVTRNYLAAALRNIARNRSQFLTNVIGLAVAIAAALLIGIFVYDELHYERFIPGSNRIYIVTTTATPPEGHASLEALPSEPDVASWLKLDAQGVEQAVRLAPASVLVRRGNFSALEKIQWADPDLFSVLHLPVYAGNLQSSLQRPDGLVLTRAMARKYFGRDDPIGETLEFPYGEQMTVTAVLEDLPSATHLDLRIIASGKGSDSVLTELDHTPMPSFGEKPWRTYTYVRLRSGVMPADLERQLPALLDRHAPAERAMPTSNAYHLHLLPISAVHLEADARGAMKPAGHRETAYWLAGVGALILIVATVNFINLMTVRANRRSVEIGVRKFAGARRLDLIVQFMGECLIYVGCAWLVAVSLTELLLPALNAFLQRTMEFPYWSDPWLGASTVVFVLLLTVAAGIYPALVLSALRPARVFGSTGLAPAHDATRVRRALVTAQVAILIGLVLATIVIYRQAMFAINQSLRLDTAQVLVIRASCDGPFKDAIKSVSGVLAVACSSWAPPDPIEAALGASTAAGHSAVLGHASIDFGFFELYGLHPLAGRFQDLGHGTDTLSLATSNEAHESIVLNEAAVHALGFTSAQAAVGQIVSWNRVHRSEVIGVVPDFLIGSIREPIQPALFYVDPSSHSALSVRISGQSIPATLGVIDQLWKRTRHSVPISRSFVDQLLQGKYSEFMRQATLLAIFSAIAVLIACIGLYVLSAFTAVRRKKEIGVRKALGAQRSDITRLLMWDFAKPVLWANLIAWTAGFFVMNYWLAGFAYHTQLRLWIFLISGGLATAVTLLTVLVHTLSIAREKPVAALRYE